MIYAADYTVHEPPPEIAADRGLLLDVTVTNRGDGPWYHDGPTPCTLSYRWLDAAGRVVIPEGWHVALPRTLWPGQGAPVELLVEPPGQPGSYTLQVELVHEDVAWFGQRGVPPLSLPLLVSSPLRAGRRVTLVGHNCHANDAMGNNLLEQLRFFRSQGDQVLALVEHVDERHPRDVRADLFRIQLEGLRAGGGNPLTRRAVEHFAASDLFIFNYPSYYPLAEAIRLVQSGQVIFDYHCITPPALWGDRQGLDDLLRGQRQLSLARYADYAIAHSEYGRQELLAAGSIAAELVSVVPYSTTVEQFRPGPPDGSLVAKYGLANRPVLLYVGRMAGNKRVIDLVRALPLISARHPGTMLLLVGDDRTPPYPQVVAEAREEAAALGCAAQVIFTGPISHSELQRFYNSCDLFVTASQHEGFCIPVVEAMACGKPAVAAAATALPETIGPGGLLFPPGDVSALAQCVNELLEARMGATS